MSVRAEVGDLDNRLFDYFSEIELISRELHYRRVDPEYTLDSLFEFVNCEVRPHEEPIHYKAETEIPDPNSLLEKVAIFAGGSAIMEALYSRKKKLRDSLRDVIQGRELKISSAIIGNFVSIRSINIDGGAVVQSSKARILTGTCSMLFPAFDDTIEIEAKKGRMCVPVLTQDGSLWHHFEFND